MIQTETGCQTVSIEQYNELLQQLQATQARNSALKRENQRKDSLLLEMAAEINKLKAELAEQLWQRRLAGVSASVCSSAKKKVLQAIYARYQEEPGETIMVSRQYLANKSGIDASTVSYHLKDLEEQGLLTRQEGSGKQLEIKLEPRVLANPSYIPKIVPPSPPRKKPTDIERALEDQHCPNCGSPDVQLHILGDCFSCKEPFIVSLGYPEPEPEMEEQPSLAHEVEPVEQLVVCPENVATWPKPEIACYFCRSSRYWFWSDGEGEYLCSKCLSPERWSKHNYEQERFPETGD